MKFVTLTDNVPTSHGRMVKHARVQLVDAEADALIQAGSAKPYDPEGKDTTADDAKKRDKARKALAKKYAPKATKAPKKPATAPAGGQE